MTTVWHRWKLIPPLSHRVVRPDHNHPSSHTECMHGISRSRLHTGDKARARRCSGREPLLVCRHDGRYFSPGFVLSSRRFCGGSRRGGGGRGHLDGIRRPLPGCEAACMRVSMHACMCLSIYISIYLHMQSTNFSRSTNGGCVITSACLIVEGTYVSYAYVSHVCLLCGDSAWIAEARASY